MLTPQERLADLSRAETVEDQVIVEIVHDIRDAAEATRLIDWLEAKDGSYGQESRLSYGKTAAEAGLGGKRHEVAKRLKTVAESQFGRL